MPEQSDASPPRLSAPKLFQVQGWHRERSVQIEVQSQTDIEIARRIIAEEVQILDRQCKALEVRLRAANTVDSALERSKAHPTFDLKIEPVQGRDAKTVNSDAPGPAHVPTALSVSLGAWLQERFPDRGRAVAWSQGDIDLRSLGFEVSQVAAGEGRRARAGFEHPQRYRSQSGSFAHWLIANPFDARRSVAAFVLSGESSAADHELLHHRLYSHQVICAPRASTAANLLLGDWDGAVAVTGDGYVVFFDAGPRYLDPLALSAEQLATLRWPKITVVTVSYNQRQYLEDCLRSVLDQDYPNLEYIVVDGLSTDGSQELLRSYEAKIDKLIIEKDRGQSDGLNKGLDLATGDILTWINSDDMLAPGALKRAAQAFLRYDCDLVTGGCERITDSSDEVLFLHHAALPMCRKVPLGFSENFIWSRSWARGDYFFQPEVLFTADIWKRSGGFLKEHLHWAMDWELWIRMALAGASVVHIPEAIGRSRVHGEQKTTAEERYLFQLRNILLEHDAVLANLAAAHSLPSAMPAPQWISNLEKPGRGQLGPLLRRLWSLRDPAKLKRALSARLRKG